MSIAGIIAEFNPLHNGHKYLINKAKPDGNVVVCTISGNFVQRGDCAILPKNERAKCALLAGADIIAEIPSAWSLSTAQNFALAGVSQLSALGIDCLYFGSECGDEELLCKISDATNTPEYNSYIKENLNSGKTFAKLREEAVEQIIGKDASILSNPNDALAVEYINATKRLNLDIKFKAVKRQGAGHNDIVSSDGYSSSTLLRNALRNHDIDYVEKFVPNEVFDLIIKSPKADIKRLEVAVLARIKQLSLDEIKKLPDISEGLDNLLYKSIKYCYSLDDLYDSLKSKRYTLARIRRIILYAFLGIDESSFLKEPPYVRLLGFTDAGAKSLPSTARKPIVTKVSQIMELDDVSKRVFKQENRISEVYSLSLDNPADFVSEYKFKLIRL